MANQALEIQAILEIIGLQFKHGTKPLWRRLAAVAVEMDGADKTDSVRRSQLQLQFQVLFLQYLPGQDIEYVVE